MTGQRTPSDRPEEHCVKTLQFIGKRLVFGIFLLLVVSFLVFSLQAGSKGSLVSTVLGGRPATAAQVAQVRADYHLDDPFWQRYLYWLGDALHFDFGRSIRSQESVFSAILERLPITLELTVLSIVLVVLLGVPLGMVSGIKRGSLTDRVVTSLSIVGLSAPVFATGIFLLYVFGVFLGWFPSFGAGEGFGLDRLKHLVLPSLALAATMVAIVARQTRAVTLDVMNQDYITFARARGLSRRRIMLAYALRNISMPIVTITGLLLIYLIGGTILVEQVFSIEGLGNLMVTSVQSSDIPVVQGISLVFAVFVVIVTLVVDLIGMWIDPRTMYPTEG
ncbi:ABC transporter permease [Aeromicrobium fastidiosum]|uniref:ABC transporter permease n=1 Tax=Aeromicrobium fastidiosum TaxID=52699 RepID=A0A641AIY3_9ACTN|nr:ABC transporter permease [Aeromicrobium fastidiosum]